MPLSYSQIRLYRRCPKQYEYAAVKRIFRPMSEGESFGASLHNALRRWGELEMLRAEPEAATEQISLFPEPSPPPPLALTEATLLGFWRSCFIATGYGSRAAMDAALLRGERAMRQFLTWWSAQSRRVVAVERGFRITIPGPKPVTLTGRFDRVENVGGGLVVIDYKSTPPPAASVDTNLQLSVYALAAREIFDEPVTALTLLSVTEDGVVEQVTSRTTGELADAATSIRLVCERIHEGDFRATPSRGVCAGCPYREICREAAR